MIKGTFLWEFCFIVSKPFGSKWCRFERIYRTFIRKIRGIPLPNFKERL